MVKIVQKPMPKMAKKNGTSKIPPFGPITCEGCLLVAVVLLVQMGFYLFFYPFFLAYLTLFVHSFLDPNKGLVTLRVAG